MHKIEVMRVEFQETFIKFQRDLFAVNNELDAWMHDDLQCQLMESYKRSPQ